MKNQTKKKELFRCNIAGVQYSDYQLCLGLKAGAKLDLWWERGNPHDPQAIRVEYRGIKLGYIPRGPFQEKLHEYLQNGIKVFTSMVSVNENNPSWHRFVLKCEVRDKTKEKEVQF